MSKLTIYSKDKRSELEIELSKDGKYFEVHVDLGDDGHCDSQIGQENFDVRAIDLLKLLVER